MHKLIILILLNRATDAGNYDGGLHRAPARQDTRQPRTPMFSTSEQMTRATWALCEAQMAALTSYVNAAVDAGMHTAEVQADAVRTALASNTVLARQWLDGGQLTPWAVPARVPLPYIHQGQTGLQLEQ
jgi:hypothetical protein